MEREGFSRPSTLLRAALRPFDKLAPVVRAGVAEPAAFRHLLDHQGIVTSALRARSADGFALRRRSTDASRGLDRPRGGDPRADLVAKPRHIAQAEPDGTIAVHRAVPVRHLHVDRM